MGAWQCSICGLTGASVVNPLQDCRTTVSPLVCCAPLARGTACIQAQAPFLWACSHQVDLRAQFANQTAWAMLGCDAPGVLPCREPAEPLLQCLEGTHTPAPEGRTPAPASHTPAGPAAAPRPSVVASHAVQGTPPPPPSGQAGKRRRTSRRRAAAAAAPTCGCPPQPRTFPGRCCRHAGQGRRPPVPAPRPPKQRRWCPAGPSRPAGIGYGHTHQLPADQRLWLVSWRAKHAQPKTHGPRSSGRWIRGK